VQSFRYTRRQSCKTRANSINLEVIERQQACDNALCLFVVAIPREDISDSPDVGCLVMRNSTVMNRQKLVLFSLGCTDHHVTVHSQ
jgi:hypothetical protein